VAGTVPPFCAGTDDFLQRAASGAASDDDFARIIAAWPTLPEHLKRAMLAMLG